MGVEGLSREVLRLRQYVIIKVREHGRVEADVVLDQQNHLHTSFVDVVLDVHLVLNELDDGENQVGIA